MFKAKNKKQKKFSSVSFLVQISMFCIHYIIIHYCYNCKVFIFYVEYHMIYTLFIHKKLKNRSMQNACNCEAVKKLQHDQNIGVKRMPKVLHMQSNNDRKTHTQTQHFFLQSHYALETRL